MSRAGRVAKLGQLGSLTRGSEAFSNFGTSAYGLYQGYQSGSVLQMAVGGLGIGLNAKYVGAYATNATGRAFSAASDFAGYAGRTARAFGSGFAEGALSVGGRAFSGPIGVGAGALARRLQGGARNVRAVNLWNEFQAAAKGRFAPSAVRPTTMADFWTQVFPRSRITHVLNGDVKVNPNSGVLRAGGFYHRPNGISPAGSRVRGRPSDRNTMGVYEGFVRVRHSGPPAQWVDKVHRSTFFPDRMNRSEVLAEIYEAYQHAVHVPGTFNTFRHTNASGLTIDLYIHTQTNKIISAFPRL